MSGSLGGRRRTTRAPKRTTDLVITDEIIERDESAQQIHDACGNIETDPLPSTRLKSLPRGLANARGTSGRSLRQPVLLTPPLDSNSYVHLETDSNQSLTRQQVPCVAIPIDVTSTRQMAEDLRKRVADRLSSKLRKQLVEDFGEWDDEGGGYAKATSREIVAKTGVSWAVLGQLKSGEGGLGLNALLAMRRYLGAPIDA